MAITEHPAVDQITVVLAIGDIYTTLESLADACNYREGEAIDSCNACDKADDDTCEIHEGHKVQLERYKKLATRLSAQSGVCI